MRIAVGVGHQDVIAHRASRPFPTDAGRRQSARSHAQRPDRRLTPSRRWRYFAPDRRAPAARRPMAPSAIARCGQPAGPIADVRAATDQHHVVRRVADRNFAHEFTTRNVDLCQRVVDIDRNEHRFAFRVHNKSNRQRSAATPAASFRRQDDGCDRGQLALVRYVEHTDVAPRARRIEALAVGRESNSLKASPVRSATDDSAGLDFDEHHLAYIKHRQPTAVRRERHIGRPAVDDHLPARR